MKYGKDGLPKRKPLKLNKGHYKYKTKKPHASFGERRMKGSR